MKGGYRGSIPVDMKIAERWVSPEHECPHCGHIQLDQWGERLWCCERCKKDYELPKLDSPND